MLLLKRIPSVIFVVFSLLSTTTGFWDGQDGEIGQFPYNVFISFLGTSFYCNGALLSNEWVITSAGCIYGYSEFRIDIGALHYANTSEDGRILDITAEVYWHYSEAAKIDVALLKLNRYIKFTDKIQPVNLPKLRRNVTEIRRYPGGRKTIITETLFSNVISYELHPTYVSGWKANDKETGKIQWIEMRILSNSDCKDKFAFPDSVINSTICAIGGAVTPNNQSVCPEDRGAPLVLQLDSLQQNRTLVGIHQHSAIGCPQVEPQIFTRITSCLEWIKTISGIE